MISLTIPGLLKAPKDIVHSPKCSNIVHHKQHAYNERGKVIVVDIADEDRQEYVNSFADQCGLKNVLAQLSKTGDVLAFRALAYDPDKEAGDETLMPEKINDIYEEGRKADSTIADAVANFNKSTGLNLTVEEFTAKVNDGTLMDYMKAQLEAKEKEGEEGK